MMKSLKLLWVLLVSFVILGFNVNAKEISNDYKFTVDETEVIEVVADSKVVIDLQGQKLTVTDNHAIIVNENASVTIKGNGIVSAKKAAVLNKGGEVIIENGTFMSNEYYTIKNLGVMTINGGTYAQAEDNKEKSSLISNGWYASKDDGVLAPNKENTSEAVAIMTINDGTFNHFTETATIKSDDWSKTTIKSGNFNSVKGTLVQATGEVLVSGGNFLGYNSIALFNGTEEKGYEPANLTISGGTYSAKYIIWPFTSGTLTITGGTFNNVEKFINTEKTGKEAKYIVSGGKFAIDVNEYVEEGLYATLNGNLYEVGKPVVESEIEVINPEKIEEVKEVTVGVKANDKTDSILSSSIVKDKELAEKTKDISVNVDIEIETIKEEDVSEEVKTAIKSIKEKAGKATVETFFDISILVKNTNTKETLGNVTNLTEEIELMILLPENLKNNDTKLSRNYYVLREHDGKVDIINAELSNDGKYLVFKTDKFSTYALAYEDTLKETSSSQGAIGDSSEEDKIETEKVDTENEDKEEANVETKPEVENKVEDKNEVEVPKTLDGITISFILTFVLMISLVCLRKYFKNELARKGL